MDGLIGHLDSHGIRVGIGIDDDSFHPKTFARLDDPHGDLATIGDQDLLEQTCPLKQQLHIDCSGLSPTERNVYEVT